LDWSGTRPSPAVYDEPIGFWPRPIPEEVQVQMANALQWIGLAFGGGVIALGVSGFVRGLSLPPDTPEHRAHGKGDNWRT
jgi:hypothetical protein